MNFDFDIIQNFLWQNCTRFLQDKEKNGIMKKRFYSDTEDHP